MAVYQPTGDSREHSPRRWLWIAIAVLCATLLTAAIVLLYLGSQFVMAEGGFVARGGPYEIAHPAPDWVILIPASIWVGFLAGGIHLLAANRAGGFNLLGIAWVALFGVLGTSFLQAGFNPPVGRIAWAWVVCGVVFWAMALPVALGVIGGFRPDLRTRFARAEVRELAGAHGTTQTPTGGAAYIIGHLLAVPAGIALGMFVWSTVTGL
jgi:hypothetical protein